MKPAQPVRPALAASASAAHGPWRWREREWVWLAAAVSACCLLFALWPALDLHVAAWFYRDGAGFEDRGSTFVRAVYVATPWFGRASGLVGLAAGLAMWRWPARTRSRWWRRSVQLALAMLLGTGLLVNGALKENWGRARPNSVQEFGGKAVFAPALRPTRECRTNCSFVSGHAATGFTLMAIGLLGTPRTRRRWLLVGITTGLVVGAVRIVQGGHFLSDVLFSGLVVWLGCSLLREAWWRLVLRRRRRRLPAAPAGLPTG